MKTSIVAALLFSIVIVATSCAQTKAAQKKRFQPIFDTNKALVESRDFKFVGDFVYNNKNREPLTEENNTIKINQSVISGKMVSLSFEKQTYYLNGKIENYKVSYNEDNQQIAITFKVITATSTQDVYLDIKPNGNSFLTLSVDPNTTVSYVGKIQKL